MLTERSRHDSGKVLLPADRTEYGAPIPFDRRRSAREQAKDSLMAAFICERAGITLARVELRDSSRDGAGLRCPLRVEPGTRFSLYRDGRPLSQDRGVVSRCMEAKDGFVLGLRFDADAPAAA